MPRVLLLTGTCGSGKTTIAAMLAEKADWIHISEDTIWHNLYGKNRGPFHSDEHRQKRRNVHKKVMEQLLTDNHPDRNIVIDVTIHESPPEAYKEYQHMFEEHSIVWDIRVLHPRLEVAVARDANRNCWTIGKKGVIELRRKFNKGIFNSECYLDNSDETAEVTMQRILDSYAA